MAQDAFFPRKIIKCVPRQFFVVFSENTAFFEKIVELKNIQHQIFDIKVCIHFWCKMTPDRSHNDPAAVLQSYFYVPKYNSSDALPAPEILFPYLCPQNRMQKFDKFRDAPRRYTSFFNYYYSR